MAKVIEGVKSRDKKIDLLLALGIIMVVMGHKYQPTYFYFPAYTFHIPLFFFISGYLAKVNLNIKDKIAFFIKKAKILLLPYFVLNMFFAIITYLLSTKSINLGVVLKFDSINAIIESLKTFFIQPFISGNQFSLFIPAWFVLQLFIVHIVFQLLHLKNKYWLLFVYIACTISTVFLLERGLNSYTDYHLLIIRTGYSLFFFLSGYILKRFGKVLEKIVYSEVFLIIAFILVIQLINTGGVTQYAIVFGNILNEKVIIPLLNSLLIILISFNLANVLAKVISDKSIFLKIGQHTFSIMVWHLSVFFIINLVIYKLGLIDGASLDNVYFGYNISQIWPIYIFLGIFIPIKLSSIYNIFINKFKYSLKGNKFIKNLLKQ